MKIIRNIYEVFEATERRKFIPLFVLMLISAVLEVMGVGSVPVVIRFILEPDDLKKIPDLYSYLETHDLLSTTKLFYVGSCLIISVFVLKNVYRVFVDYKELKLVKNVQINLATSLYRKYLYSPYWLHLQRSTSVLIRNIQNEVSYITSKVLIPLFLVLLNLVILLAIFISMVAIQPLLTSVIVCVLLLAMGSFNLLIRKRLRIYGKIMQRERRNQLQYLYQGLHGLKAVKVANKESFFINLFKKSTEKFANIQLKVNVLAKVPNGYLEIVAIVIILFLVGSMLYLGYEGNQLTYLLSFFALALIRMRQNFSAIMTNMNLIRTNEVSLDPVLEDLKINFDREDDINSKEPFTFNEKISFHDVSFKYKDAAENVINGISFSIKKGEIIGIAGATGGGKSTLVDLMLGLHKPSEGAIKIDDKDIKYDLSNWQGQVGYVPQNIFLLDDTIIANVAFGEENVNIEQVETVLKAAQLDVFIESLQDGSRTVIGENGVRLSGGQRQRVGIARALYHKPQVLIFDEATSALDNKTEKKFVEILYNLGKEITILMIAHRLTTLERCDRILLLKNGEIVEEGTYEFLINKEGDFKKLATIN